jgi:hypothetical protein
LIDRLRKRLISIEEFMGDIIFDGAGPFPLPAARSVGALSSRDRVEMSVRIQVGHAREETLLISLSVNQAVELAGLLNAATGNALRS